MLKISMTYETITPESAEDGDAAEHGFVFEACDCTAHELAKYITREGFTEPSDAHGVPGNVGIERETVEILGAPA